jgi:hypothetical protein
MPIGYRLHGIVPLNSLVEPLHRDVIYHSSAAGMMEAAKGFRRLKAYKHLPALRAALAAHQSKYVTQRVEHDADAA